MAARSEVGKMSPHHCAGLARRKNATALRAYATPLTTDKAERPDKNAELNNLVINSENFLQNPHPSLVRQTLQKGLHPCDEEQSLAFAAMAENRTIVTTGFSPN
jgi:hypothetical protein